MKDATRILTRHPENPLISPEDIPCGAKQVFNPAPARHEGKTILLLSVLPWKTDHLGDTWLAWSDDGVHFTVDEKPFIELASRPFPYSMVSRHIIDNRLTKIDDTYYILTPVGGGYTGPSGVLGKTRDFKTYEPVEIICPPPERGASLFPEKIGGKYYKLDRPGAGEGARGSIWLSSSPDLVHWGCFRPLLMGGWSHWNAYKIGPTPPVRTHEGWLVIVHGVSVPCDGPHYAIGAILLDIEDPLKIVGRTYSTLLHPEAEYEVNGWVDNVVFPCGAIADAEADELWLYYGGADTRICLATGSLSEVLDACKQEI